MTTEQAIEKMRADPAQADLIREAYLGADTAEAAARFGASPEFEEATALVGGFDGKEVLDLGAGTGIATAAIARAGAKKVHALEPDSSSVVGRGAIASIAEGLPIEMIDAFAEKIPLPDASVDVVYTRQVLHHTSDLPAVGRECSRILRPGGVMLACREHVVDDDAELQAFFAAHPVHQLAGGEGAYSLREYQGAMGEGDLKLTDTWATFDSIINCFPGIPDKEELARFRRRELGPVLARMGRLVWRIPPAAGAVQKRLAPHLGPGRMYSFRSVKRA